MPLELTWHIALVLVGDGLLFGLGYFLASAVYNAIAWLIAQRRSSGG